MHAEKENKEKSGLAYESKETQSKGKSQGQCGCDDTYASFL